MGGEEGKSLLTAQTSLPAIYHLFLHLKKYLAGQKLHEDEEVQNKVTTWLHTTWQSSMTSEYQNSYPGQTNA
jgi:hypothetical protein